MVIDNHNAHRGQKKEEILDQFCETQFIPTYSCELNSPIETTWAIVKKRVIPKFTQLQLKKKSTRERCIEVLKKELTKIDPSTFENLLRSHYCYLT